MENNNSSFRFRPSTGGSDKDIDKTDAPTETEKASATATDETDVKKVTYAEKKKEEMNAPFTEKRTVTVALVKNYSMYRKVNERSLPPRRDYIGSSIESSRTLSSVQGEIEKYFPKIIGVSPRDDSFMARVKQYLNNIQIAVDDAGKTFDISFHYERYEDYLKVRDAEEEIDNNYKNAPKTSVKLIRDAVKRRVDSLNALESTKYKYGYPLNMDDYLMYRHCLLYKDVAKDVSLINTDSSIRFYIKDDAKELQAQKKARFEANKAKQNYVGILGNDEMFDAVYAQYCIMNGKSVVINASASRLIKEEQLDKFSIESPFKFNKIVEDKDIIIKSLIEVLIERGELIRTPYNQNITTLDGELIGANMKEVVAFFKSPTNTPIVEAYKAKLKNI